MKNMFSKIPQFLSVSLLAICSFFVLSLLADKIWSTDEYDVVYQEDVIKLQFGLMAAEIRLLAQSLLMF